MYLCTHCWSSVGNPLGLCAHCGRFPKLTRNGDVLLITRRKVVKYMNANKKRAIANMHYGNDGAVRKHARDAAHWGNILLKINQNDSIQQTS